MYLKNILLRSVSDLIEVKGKFKIKFPVKGTIIGRHYSNNTFKNI